ncbi:TPA: hypothetical protein MM834_003353 [Salmonella enterica subsp. houtenae]|nr:hypothetical protein [Salmonella enterica subsp. houtenae serovar 40:z4,z24:-]HBZ8550740.1 hypothetical protein [Salmonella enterica subsp. houtenae]
MKYIILRLDGKIPREVPVIFPDLLVHADVARTMATTIKEDSSNTNITDVRVVSAGFCNTAVECFGKSETLNIASRDIDNTVINTVDYTFGLLFGE